MFDVFEFSGLHPEIRLVLCGLQTGTIIYYSECEFFAFALLLVLRKKMTHKLNIGLLTTPTL